jgi:hypothetical protein
LQETAEARGVAEAVVVREEDPVDVPVTVETAVTVEEAAADGDVLTLPESQGEGAAECEALTLPVGVGVEELEPVGVGVEELECVDVRVAVSEFLLEAREELVVAAVALRDDEALAVEVGVALPEDVAVKVSAERVAGDEPDGEPVLLLVAEAAAVEDEDPVATPDREEDPLAVPLLVELAVAVEDPLAVPLLVKLAVAVSDG